MGVAAAGESATNDKQNQQMVRFCKYSSHFARMSINSNTRVCNKNKLLFLLCVFIANDFQTEIVQVLCKYNHRTSVMREFSASRHFFKINVTQSVA